MRCANRHQPHRTSQSPDKSLHKGVDGSLLSRCRKATLPSDTNHPEIISAPTDPQTSPHQSLISQSLTTCHFYELPLLLRPDILTNNQGPRLQLVIVPMFCPGS
jgi:hypothetical protein